MTEKITELIEKAQYGHIKNIDDKVRPGIHLYLAGRHHRLFNYQKMRGDMWIDLNIAHEYGIIAARFASKEFLDRLMKRDTHEKAVAELNNHLAEMAVHHIFEVRSTILSAQQSKEDTIKRKYANKFQKILSEFKSDLNKKLKKDFEEQTVKSEAMREEINNLISEAVDINNLTKELKLLIAEYLKNGDLAIFMQNLSVLPFKSSVFKKVNKVIPHLQSEVLKASFESLNEYIKNIVDMYKEMLLEMKHEHYVEFINIRYGGKLDNAVYSTTMRAVTEDMDNKIARIYTLPYKIGEAKVKASTDLFSGVKPFL